MSKPKPLVVPPAYLPWFNEQMDKAVQSPTAALPNRIREMHKVYGATEGQTCGDCAHCISVNGGSRDYYKCDLTKITSGAGSDWRLKWPACGRFEAAEVQA